MAIDIEVMNGHVDQLVSRQITKTFNSVGLNLKTWKTLN